jgi:hypothetical protein
MSTNLRVKTAQAALVAGVGYEGFRTWLKRGLLKETGTLPKFCAQHAEAQLADSKRWRWSSFGFADLCSFRLTKVMLDSGLPWEIVNSIVSDPGLWQSHRQNDANSRYLAVFEHTLQWTLYSGDTLASDLNRGIVKVEWMTLFDLQNLRQDVVLRNRAAALRAVADDVTRTTHIFVRTGPNMLAPDEAAGRQLRIEQLAKRIAALADAAEQGSGSYREFEALLTDLHAEGKFPDSSAVSAVAEAYVEVS